MRILAINITGLKVDQAQKRTRDLINTPQGTIEIYEPTMEDMQKIIDMQKGEGFESGVVSFDGITVIRELFPLLTNITIGENLTDEELTNIIENPSVHFLIAQQVIAQIVSESNKLYAERMKTELMKTESTMAQVELLNSIPALIVENAKSEGKVAELVDKAEKAGKELEEAIKKEQEELSNEQE